MKDRQYLVPQQADHVGKTNRACEPNARSELTVLGLDVTRGPRWQQGVNTRLQVIGQFRRSW